MRIEKVPPYLRLVDFILIPVMWVLSGFSRESFQETHSWHCQPFAESLVPDSAGVEVIGNDSSRFSNNTFGLMHMPLFGGWTNYVVLEAKNLSDYWYVGWKVHYFDQERSSECEIHRLPIYSSQIKVLAGLNDSKKIFFGLDKQGKIIPIKIVGSGSLGDGKYKNVRVF